MAVTVALYGIDLVLHPLPAAISGPLQQFSSFAVFYGAAALCLRRGLAWREERVAWWVFALGMVMWGTANMLYLVILDTPTADVLWVAGYVPAYVALFLVLRNRAGSVGRSAWIDGVVGALGVGGAAAALMFQTIKASTHGAVSTAVLSPVGDICLLGLVVAAITVVGWKDAHIWRWIAPAFLIFVVADCLYDLQLAAGTYAIGGIGDLGWPAGALLLGVGAARADRGTCPGVRARAAMVVPALSGLCAICLLVVDHFERLNLAALGLAMASLLVILVRLYLTVLENSRMLAHSRIEAMTDALTGLGNRRQLAADLAAHLESLDPMRPLVLTLFDLDGFKHYNDTFGHPAGDQLLTRLGGRLRDLVAGCGTAYRMGGDEFCMLWVCPGGDEAAIITMEAAAVGALSEQGEAFSIGSSYGTVRLPEETTDASDALRIADRRMYILKRGGRRSAGRQSADVLQQALAETDFELDVHLSSVANLAYASAVQLGIPEEDAEAARQTALLHDVGKVAIPDAILNKPGPLDDAEWAFMRRHTVIGERIISAAPALAVVARLVRSTHERYDGHGYPDGLAGTEIPLIARIVSVCDSYDAMITKRAYRNAHDRTWAIAELRRCAGTQFDPDVVDAVINSLKAGHTDAQVAADALDTGLTVPARRG